MTVHHVSTGRRQKTLAEGAVCFGCAAVMLLVAAMAAQWLLNLVI
jgi:hypothetical protein